jgi:hypothetical protein
MGVKATTAVWEHSATNGNALLVLLAIADCANNESGEGWASYEQLAAWARCSRATIHRSLRQLYDLGELELVERGGKRGGRHFSNVYRICLEPFGTARPPLPSHSETLAPIQGSQDETLADGSQPDGSQRLTHETPSVLSSSCSSDVAVGSSNVIEETNRSARAPVREGEAEAAASTPTNVNGRSGEKRAALAASVDRIWAAYVAIMKPRRAEIGPQERQVIQRALKEASEKECIRAIRGCSKSRHHMGDNDRGKKYNQLTNILKGKSNGRTLREQIDLMLWYDENSVSGERPSGEAAEIQAAKVDVMKYGVYDNDSLAQSLTARAGKRLAVHGITWTTTTKVLEGDNGERHVVVDRFIFSDDEALA